VYKRKSGYQEAGNQVIRKSGVQEAEEHNIRVSEGRVSRCRTSGNKRIRTKTSNGTFESGE